MAILKNKEIQEKTKDEIIQKLSELKMELSKEKGIVEVGGTSTNPGRIGEMKRTIARLNTHLKIKKE